MPSLFDACIGNKPLSHSKTLIKKLSFCFSKLEISEIFTGNSIPSKFSLFKYCWYKYCEFKYCRYLLGLDFDFH